MPCKPTSSPSPNHQLAKLSLSSSSVVTATSAITLLLMKSKIILIAAFLGGGIFSIAWNPSSQKESTIDQRSSQGRNSSGSTLSKGKKLPGFNLESLFAYIRRVDANSEEDGADESTLRLLIFNVPEQHIPSVLIALDEVSHPERFKPIVTALYARWAEIDPAEAWASAQEEERFLSQARHGVLLTWLARDSESALAALLASPHRGNLNHVRLDRCVWGSSR